MSKLYCIGELLIDFKPDTGEMTFKGNAGGAPANVCVQATKLGQEGVYLTQVGKDVFGDYLIDVLRDCGVDTSHILQTDAHSTSLSFVSLNKYGDSTYSFYRRNAPDLYFPKNSFNDITFEAGDVFEFGSVSLATAASADIHLDLIQKARASRAIVAFDPNLRPDLWSDRYKMLVTVKKFAQYADIVKLSSGEWQDLSFSPSRGFRREEPYPEFFGLNTKALLVTYGRYGAKVYLRGGKVFECRGYKGAAVDTTGAGDSFFGAFLSGMMDAGADIRNLASLPYQDTLDFACKAGAYTCTGYGAIPAMGNREAILETIREA
ncbi:MAG: carbohydrate kinase [Clostridia bacterium]|nr:carbohydrate kinase [Clostridia bacterium]